MDGRTTVETFVGQTLHGLLFLEEFVFPRSVFTTPDRQQLELADAVVMLGDVLLICQIKERNLDSAGDENSEREWFRSTVMNRAMKQVRNTLQYLNSYADIAVPNQRGRIFNLAANRQREIVKIVLYTGARTLPPDCTNTKYHVSSTAGFIHVLNASDYLEIFRTLRVPAEVVNYFKYRERLLASYTQQCGPLAEASIVGHFVGGNEYELPVYDSYRHLRGLKQDVENWDISPILRTLHDHIAQPGSEDHYYLILLEFAKLRRSFWREVHVRIRLSFEAASQGLLKLPFRIVAGTTGFVFVPVHLEVVATDAWSAGGNRRLLVNYMEAHKYDQKLSCCVGYQIAKIGEYFEVLWGFVDRDWEPDQEMDRALAKNFPFRPVAEGCIHGFVFGEGKNRVHR